MQTIPKKNVIILIIVVIVFAIIWQASSIFGTEVSVNPNQISKGDLSAFHLVGIFYSLFCLLIPLMLYKKTNSLINNQNSTSRKKIFQLLGLRFAPLFGPMICGKILLIMGMVISESYIYFAASIVGILIWGFITLRKYEGDLSLNRN